MRVKYVEVGRPAPTKVDLLRRAMEDGILVGAAADREAPPVAAEAPTRDPRRRVGSHPADAGDDRGTRVVHAPRIERIISLVAGLGALVLGAQAFLAALGPDRGEPGMARPAHDRGRSCRSR